VTIDGTMAAHARDCVSQCVQVPLIPSTMALAASVGGAPADRDPTRPSARTQDGVGGGITYDDDTASERRSFTLYLVHWSLLGFLSPTYSHRYISFVHLTHARYTQPEYTVAPHAELSRRHACATGQR
jgi:hypothetical protein